MTDNPRGLSSLAKAVGFRVIKQYVSYQKRVEP